MSGAYLTLDQINAIKDFIKVNPKCSYTILPNNPDDGSLAIQIKNREQFGSLLLNIATTTGRPINNLEKIINDEKYFGQFVILSEVG